MLEQYSIKMPKSIDSGEHALDRLAAILSKTGLKKAAIFTDQSLRKQDFFALVEEQHRQSGIPYVIFDDLPSEPTYLQVQAVIDQFKQSGADIVVAFGGGSVMDAAKLASVLMTDEYGVKELLNEPSRAKKYVPAVMIPTTAGTGAECTPNAIVGVPEKELKIGIVNDAMIADYVILDPRLIENLPRPIAAATGVDALCHAIECFTSRKANPFSDTFALEALDLIMNHIEKACDDRTAMEAKNKMQIAALYGGIAITASGTTAVHALSYPLGGKYHIAHGVSNAMLLLPVMRFNEPVCRPLFARACDRVFGERVFGMSEAEKSRVFLDRMAEIVARLGIPTSLKAFGVDPGDIGDLVDAGMSVTRLLVNNRREVTREDARKIYMEVLQ